MSIAQYLRIIWARKWLVLALLLVTTLVGTLITLFVLSKQYQAEASMVVEVRNDPLKGHGPMVGGREDGDSDAEGRVACRHGRRDPQQDR